MKTIRYEERNVVLKAFYENDNQNKFRLLIDPGSFTFVRSSLQDIVPASRQQQEINEIWLAEFGHSVISAIDFFVDQERIPELPAHSVLRTFPYQDTL